jgi:hypothetical protein
LEKNVLNEIEATLDIKYPKTYHAMAQDGMLDWGALGPNWFKDVYPKIRTNPPLLLFASDFKIIELKNVVKEWEKLKLDSSGFHRLVPFAKISAGDPFCFLFENAASINCVCKFNRRNDEAIKLARTFEDFIFREMLGSVVDVNREDIDDENEFRRDVSAMILTHKKYLPEKHIEILIDVVGRPLKELDDEFGAISTDDYFEIVEREIAFDGLGMKIPLSVRS